MKKLLLVLPLFFMVTGCLRVSVDQPNNVTEICFVAGDEDNTVFGAKVSLDEIKLSSDVPTHVYKTCEKGVSWVFKILGWVFKLWPIL